MRLYEALYILRPDLEEEQVTAQMEKYSTLVQNQGGQVVKLDKWGKKRLAYEVKKLNEGIYVLMQFQGEPGVTAELERVFKISDEVIRFLVTRLEEDDKKA